MNENADVSKIIGKIQQLKKDFNQLGLGDIPKVNDAFQKCFNADNNPQALQKAISSLRKVLKNTKIEGEELKEILDKMGAGGQVKNLEELYKRLHKDTEKLTESQERLNNAFKNFNPQHLMSGVEVFSKISAAGMQAAMVINSVKSIISAWQDEDMDPLEKFTTTLMGIGMIVPGAISSIQGISTVMNGIKASIAAFNNIQAVSNALTQEEIILNGSKIALKEKEGALELKRQADAAAEILFKKGAIAENEKEAVSLALVNAAKNKNAILTTKEILTTAASTTAKTGEIAATEGATVAQWSLNAAMEANPIGIWIAAAMALIAVLALLTVAIVSVVNAESEEEKALRKANEELEKAQEEAKAAKEAYENLYSKVSDYKTAYEALQKCTKGTKEWKEAFEEVSNKANELIEAYPDLLKYENLFDANGLIKSEALDKALKEYEKRVSATKITTIQKQANVTSAQYEVNKSNLSDKIKIDNIDERSADNIAKTITSSLSYRPDEVGKAIASSIESAQLDEKISNGVTSALLANQDKIKNYSDPESVSEVIKSYLEKNAEEYSLDNSRIDELTNEFTQKATSLGKDFSDLSIETKKTITAMTNASKMIAQEFFGEELDMSNPEKVFSYNEALQNYQAETERKMIEAMGKATIEAGKKKIQSRGVAGMTTGGVISEDDYLNKAGQAYIDNNTDEEKKNWKFKNVRSDYWNNNLEYVYVDEKGEEQEIAADQVKDFMIQYEAQRNRDKIIAAGEAN